MTALIGKPLSRALPYLQSDARPRLLIGFAAETENLIRNASEKRKKKGCDWILANDVSPAAGTFGGAENRVHLVTGAGVEDWEPASKRAIADRLAQRIADHLQKPTA
jgi:phosphopantothenoylcysteine decarboxylase/phosphopantothenate--cysteine ligase